MEKSEKMKMGCNLIIDTREIAPSAVTKITGVEASKLTVKGTPYVSFSGKEIPQKPNLYNLWMLELEKIYIYEEGTHLESAIELMLSLLDKQKERFIEAISKFPDSKLLCYCYYYDNFNPFFLFSNDLIGRLKEYNLSLEFDLYVLEEEKRNGG